MRERLRGEPATLIGIDGEQRITAEDVARRLDTINYEVTCGLTPACRASITATAWRRSLAARASVSRARRWRPSLASEHG